MRLASLHILALPGIDGTLAIDAFAPGVNLVLGPNASGKSRLAHALRCLVDPDASRGQGVHVRATFEGADGTWTVERLGDRAHWTRDGRPTEPPSLPDPTLLDAWFLRLEDLAELGRSDEAIARRLATELAGGVDLPAVRERLVTVGRNRFGTLRRDYEQARDERRRVAREVAALAAEEERADERAADLDRVRRHAARARALEAALEVLDAEARTHEIDARLAGFPPGMERLHPSVDADVAAWFAEVEDQSEALRTARRDLAEARADLDAIGLPIDRPRRADVEGLRDLARDVTDAEERLRVARAEERRARAEARSLAPPTATDGSDAVRSGADGDDASVASVEDLDALDLLEAALREAEGAVETIDRELAVPDPAVDPDVLDAEARRARGDAERLAAWLGAPARSGRALRVLRPLAWLAAVGSAAAGVFARADGAAPADGALWFVVAGVWTVAGLGLEIATPRTRARPDVQREIERREGPHPDAWDEASVHAAVDAALARATSAARRRDDAREHHARRREALQRHATAVQARDEARRRFEARARSVGLDPERTGRSALERARRAREARVAAAALAVAREATAAAEERRRDAREAVRAAWTAIGVEEVRELAAEDLASPAGDGFGAETLRLAGDLAERVRRRDEAAARADLAQRAARDTEARRDDAARVRNERLARLLDTPLDAVEADPDGMRARLTRRLERRAEWLELRAERDRLRGRSDAARERVGDEAVRQVLAAGDRAEVEAALADARHAGSHLEALQDAASRHDERVEAARRDRRLEQARREETAARDALERAYDQALDSDAAAWLLDRVDATYRTERRPDALAAAQRWFGRFTRHAFALDVVTSGHDAGLEIVDRASGAVRTPPQASSGTRAQALLALRLAHATAAEGTGPHLPFVLDEALTTSDAGRFEAVVDALAEIAREQDRQILYLSARRDDADLWRAAAERSGGRIDPPTVLDLPLLRGEAQRWDTTAASRNAQRPVPPPPGEEDPATYAARLGVPAIDPWSEAGLHPFHLLRDRLDLVYLLARLGIDRLGALQGLLADAGARDRILTPEDATLLAARARAARAWRDRWREGRGRPVDRAALEASGAVTEAFLDRVANLASQLAGDGARLLEALAAKEVARFRESSLRELEGWLIDQGYVDPRPASDASARAIACEAALSGPASSGAHAAPATSVGVDGPTLARWLDEGCALDEARSG